MRPTHSNSFLSSLLLASSLSLSNAGAISKRATTVPATLPGSWTYKGCYVDVGRTLSDAAYTDNVGMTIEKCLAFCTTKGYQYAGVEYAQECYCGATPAPAAAKVAETDCNKPCKGDATEPCGGGSRLNMFYSTTPVGPQVNPGTNGYGSIGCYSEGTGGRTLTFTPGGLDGSKMTVAMCVGACKTAGYTIAGVEYGGECYCGNSFLNGGAPATSGCSMLCKGNQMEFCGGGGRLNAYKQGAPISSVASSSTSSSSSSSTRSSTTTTTSSSTRTSTSTSTSTSSTRTSTSTSTSSTSTSTTTSRSSSTSSESSSSSSSISSSVSSSTSASSSDSSTSSPVSSSSISSSTSEEVLTGSSTSSVAPTTSSTSTSRSSTTTSSTSASATPTGPYQPATVGAFKWYGCQTEATGNRALSAKDLKVDTMTLDACATFCAGFTYFGVEYARECYCGNDFNAGSIPAPASECNMLCMGNPSSMTLCGAGNRLSVYSVNGAASSSSSSSTATTGTATTGTISSTSSTSSLPAGTGFPAGWSYQGCWVDGAQGRILPVQQPDSQTLTPQKCAQTCFAAGYSISATEWAQQCFCGNQIVNGGVKGAEADCNTPCSGDNKQMCGAGGRMSIVSNGPPTILLPPAVQTGGLNGSWTYKGCYEDNINDKRTFYWQLYFHGTMTANMCLSRCQQFGYMAAGLEYGEECYCGDPANIATSGAGLRPETECNVLCAGNSSAYCGGGSRLSTYFWTGTPLYSWTFPQTPATAGRYDKLIDGVTIPLMTMQSITGKVSFLSKWGTGKANETGAYELDLSVINNPALAWRPLHVKTDIFCSAGVILPDKGGRQLNIGGWSGDSTEGVRLYWPDGTPGTWGTHDWQENVNELSLQVGRWYPSAMVMANGKVMIIGGEEGSNGAAVPSIEVLPYNGVAPAYMDWLDRTNPNNLYPFPAVLPSGGIFVAYYNEARILNANTFATIKTLPNAPAAVNDDSGGRTYPLEGTAVLLPQKGPNYDNLGVLICGGSTNGVSNALDNCVSIYPDAPNPEWKMERMPSARVMPCMAPLPDGTYLIANGAHHGVAGFGLATGPNLNALLYDPTKPLTGRITVMANTTFARLYHSEAITLLDGRVLISGSNPEDGVNPEQYTVEVFSPPYLLNGKPRPSFTLANKDWTYGQTITVSYTASGAGPVTVSLLGAVSSTHGNSMGARVLQPAATCGGGTCTFTAPPNGNVCPPGWFQFFVLDNGVPAVGVYVRIGGDPSAIGNWPNFPDFTVPGV